MNILKNTRLIVYLNRVTLLLCDVYLNKKQIYFKEKKEKELKVPSTQYPHQGSPFYPKAQFSTVL